MNDVPFAVKDASVAYDVMQALSNVTLQLTPGITALIGPNGAGKTTRFRVSGDVLPPDAGTVRLAVRDPGTDASSKSTVGYIVHGPALDGRRTVRANLDFWSRAYDLDMDEVNRNRL